MSEEVLVNVLPGETRLALLDNGLLQELFVERSDQSILVGNIFKGKVSRVLPGMQAAFIDIGLERTAFLHASDVVNYDEAEDDASIKQEERPITELVREGQEILVQVIKDPLGTKGARLSTALSIASRFLVYMPTLTKPGVSQRITDETERARLLDTLERCVDDSLTGHFIIRTNSEGASDEDFKSDISLLLKLWQQISQKFKAAKCGEVVYEDLHLVIRTLRDVTQSNLSRVRIDNESLQQKCQSFLEKFIPETASLVEFYNGEKPIFDLYAVEDQVEKSLSPKVLLKSGGSIVIEQTEAMTTIDVNTGGFIGHKNVDDTIYRTNLEATGTIARQLRLRNLGGIIIIDFIDMDSDAHQKEVLRALSKALQKDSAKTTVGDFSELGLVEVTRKRTRDSITRLLCEPCPMCHAKGFIKSVESICFDIFRDIIRQAKAYTSKGFVVIAAPKVIDILLDEAAASLAELETLTQKRIQLKVESTYSQEQYDVVLI